MDRAAYIQEIKTALDAEDRKAVEALVAERLFADVADRAQAALARLPAPPVELKDGYYTVQLADGHVTLRVERRGETAKFAPGEQIVARLTGPQNTSDYQGVAFAKPGPRFMTWKRFRGDARLADALAVLAGDPKAAALGYARESGRCYLCGRLLTTPESLDSGIGPVCASKGY